MVNIEKWKQEIAKDEVLSDAGHRLLKFGTLIAEICDGEGFDGSVVLQAVQRLEHREPGLLNNFLAAYTQYVDAEDAISKRCEI